MNLQYLKNNVGDRFQLVPEACELDQFEREIPGRADEWLYEHFSDSTIKLSNLRTGHVLTLAHDHIHGFTSNPAGSLGSIKRGFLKLHVQVFLRGDKCWVTPTVRPGEPFRFAAPRMVEKWVDFQYPTRIGLAGQMATSGYELKWAWETKLARLTDIEGWEIVEQLDQQGAINRFRVRDTPHNQTLIRRKVL